MLRSALGRTLHNIKGRDVSPTDIASCGTVAYEHAISRDELLKELGYVLAGQGTKIALVLASYDYCVGRDG